MRRFLPTLLLLSCTGRVSGVGASDPLSTLGSTLSDSGLPATPTTLPTTDSAPAPTDTGATELASVCDFTDELRVCPHHTLALPTGTWGPRNVHVQFPAGSSPAAGWPVAILFQGSFFSAENFWEARPSDPFGAWHQTGVVQSLLDAGFAVVTPEALANGNAFWTSNIPPYNVAWSTSPDHDLMLALFDGFEDGTFLDVDPTRLYAAGISSGGYMTSRMAEAYPGRFRALAIHSGSWCTCGGAACLVPSDLPADHPPTLFLHGESDAVVPVGTMRRYDDALGEQGFEHLAVTLPGVGHEWLDVAPDEVTQWFLTHP